ncbi:(deoxy)nucleoside triphosphate pyrophosphohydrolase [Geminisphaera colitermitum]|uniref:(deoxy)nucleoside triphosphate pyrophosphohydrolase n=1 Tax=Geminisphaera colitermitum TaxID=1148786 RepID=UPI000158CCB3|nr:(deoxy)nucleoside triphosphate pyrophosphohydrolase [Geminisphaera colitermitum]
MGSSLRSPISVVCALIEREGRVFVAQRPAGKHLGGKWEFPGGKIEPGETSEQALIRECREELGCEIVVGRALTPVTHDYETVSIRLIPFVARLAAGSGEPVAHEHAATRWIQPEEFASLDMPAADEPIIRAYLEDVLSAKDGRQNAI